ncbi:Small-conductance mechanosensitive channel [compost metagenome]
MTRFGVVLMGVLIAAVVLFPSVKPADVLAFLGLGSVAVGFAFKDIFQNFMAGLLILFRRPFRLGDQIRSGELEGTVEDINLRATIIKTYDGERVIIPNSDVYSRPVLVRTAYGMRRSRFIVGIGYGDDIDEAKQVILARLEALPGVLDEPAPWLRTVELAPSSVNLEVFYWTKAQQHEVLQVGDAVATAIKYALDAAGIDMPFPVRRVLVEETAPRRPPGASPPAPQA